MDYDAEALKQQRFYVVCDIEQPYHLETQSFLLGDKGYFSTEGFGIDENIEILSHDPHFHDHVFQAVVPDEDVAYEIETHPFCIVIFIQVEQLDTASQHIQFQPQEALIAHKETGQIYWEYVFQHEPQPREAVAAASHPTSEAAVPVREVPATFPGGEAALVKYIAEHLKYPAAAREQNIQGKVVVKFTIDKEGKAVRPVILKSLSEECDQEALRIVQSLPRFTPATQNGHPVETTLQLPFRFSLN